MLLKSLDWTNTGISFIFLTENLCRKSTMKELHLCPFILQACAAIDKVTAMTGGQTVDQCPMCCRSDFCNDNCRRNLTGKTLRKMPML